MRKNKTSLLVFIVLFLGGTWSACSDQMPCKLVQDEWFSFRLFSKNGVNQIAAWGARYVADSIYLTKINGNVLSKWGVVGSTNISLFIPESFEEAIDSPITHTFLLYLPDYDGTPRKDVDTLAFTYKASLIKHAICYEWLRVRYNDSLYHDGDYTYFITFTKN